MVARAVALRGGLVGVDVDRPIVDLYLHHRVHRVPVALVARRRRGRARRRAGAAGGRSAGGLALAPRTDLTVGRATLVALAPEADEVTVAGEVAVLAVRDVAVTTAELADRAVVAVCEQIDWLVRTS